MPAPEIFVRLLDENVDVWRPVRAEHVHGDVYRIVDQPFDRETEQWEFEPGDEVVCELIDASEGRILAAVAQHHATFPHVFGVLRIDGAEDVDWYDRLWLTSVFTADDAAEEDAARRDAIERRRGSGATYVTLESRLNERPGVEAAAADAPHACEGMANALGDSRVPLVYLAKFREYGLVAGSRVRQTIDHCPWCASTLPPSLRDEFFHRLDAMGLEIEDAPVDFRTDAWWKREGIGG